MGPLGKNKEEKIADEILDSFNPTATRIKIYDKIIESKCQKSLY